MADNKDIAWKSPHGLYEAIEDKREPVPFSCPDEDEYLISSSWSILRRKAGEREFAQYRSDDEGMAYWDYSVGASLQYDWEELAEFHLTFLPEKCVEEYHLRKIDRAPVFIAKVTWFHKIYDDAGEKVKEFLNGLTRDAYDELVSFRASRFEEWKKGFQPGWRIPQFLDNTLEEKVETCSAWGKGCLLPLSRTEKGAYAFIERRYTPQLPNCTVLGVLEAYAGHGYHILEWYLVYNEGADITKEEFLNFTTRFCVLIDEITALLPEISIQIRRLTFLERENTKLGYKMHYQDMNDGTKLEWEYTTTPGYVREDGMYHIDPTQER